MKHFLKVEPQKVPVVGCTIKNDETTLRLTSNYGDDEVNGNLNKAKSIYEGKVSAKILFLSLTDMYNECISLSIADAEELIETLQSMVDLVKGN